MSGTTDLLERAGVWFLIFQMALIWKITKGMAVHGVAHYDILDGALKIIISNIHHLSKNNLISSCSSQV